VVEIFVGCGDFLGAAPKKGGAPYPSDLIHDRKYLPLDALLVRSAHGRLAALLPGSGTFTHDEIQERFFTEGSHFRDLMQRLSELSDQTFGHNNKLDLSKSIYCCSSSFCRL
jgi:hypothetical protein